MTMPLPAEPSALRMVLTLGVAGFVSGLAIVGIFVVTKPTIDANKARELREAVLEVLPGAATMAEVELGDGSVYAGRSDDGGLVGYAIPAEGGGFQDTIKLIYGFDPSRRRIVGMYVLESRETPGLGDKIYKDAAFVGAFRDLAVDPKIVLTKKGTAQGDNEVDAITGATISSRAVVSILNQSAAATTAHLPEGD
jgi:Na+-translocating ferredoxin:NAD+ oxidoreductase subunit G